MARFEYGKGKKKSYWDVEQLGRTVRSQDSGMLSGYQTFAGEEDARAALQRFVAEHIGGGFAPSDDEARALASLVAQPSKEAVAVTLPIRRDIYVYNDATGMMFTSMDMAGVALEEGSEEWNAAIAQAKMIPVSLFQDDTFVVRVVAGEPLSAQESDEWVARLEWPLEIPGGKLAITGGAVLTNDEYDPDDRYFESYIRTVDVPPGKYRATVYSYVPGINARAALDYLAGGYDKSERLGAWFRRTRPGEPFPDWLHNWNVGSGSADPGHEDEWKDAKLLDHAAETIDFLLHLEPDPKAAAPGDPPEEGWFGEAENARKPERAPRGLEGRNVEGHEDKNKNAGWMFLFELPDAAQRFEPISIAGGPVELSPDDIPLLYRIARFTHRHTVPEFRATLSDGQILATPLQGPPETLALLRGKELLIAFGNNQMPDEIIGRIEALGPLFATLPDGTELQFISAQLDERAFGEGVPVGLHRYRGLVEGGRWIVTHAFPEMDAATFRSALALAREVAGGDAIVIQSDDEGNATLKWANGNHKIWIEDNPATIADGRLALGNREPGVLSLYGSSVFAVRFRDTWPVLNLADDEEEESGDASDPLQGTKVLETPGGRMYFATSALIMSDSVAERIQADEPALSALGYEHVADIVCNLFPKIAIRSYAKDGGDTWASYLVAAPSTLVLELSTRFARDNASLLTTRLTNAQDEPEKQSYRQVVPDGTIAEMDARHTQRKSEIAAMHGDPIVVERSAAGLAQSVEASLKKQLGG